MKIEFNSASESPALTGKIDIKEKQEKTNKNKQKQKERAKTKTKRQVADDSKVVYKETFIMKGRVNEKEIRTRKFRVQSNLLVHVWMSRDMLLLSSFLENLNKSGIKVNSRNKPSLSCSSVQDQVPLQTFILNEIQPDRHCGEMASREGEKIGNVDLK